MVHNPTVCATQLASLADYRVVCFDAHICVRGQIHRGRNLGKKQLSIPPRIRYLPSCSSIIDLCLRKLDLQGYVLELLGNASSCATRSAYGTLFMRHCLGNSPQNRKPGRMGFRKGHHGKDSNECLISARTTLKYECVKNRTQIPPIVNQIASKPAQYQ